MKSLDEAVLLSLAAKRHHVLRNDRIVLYAGANLPSDTAMAAYSPGLSAYPAMGPSFGKEQPETELVSHLEVAVGAAACALFDAAWAESRLPSCTLANLAVYYAFARPGDLMLAPAAVHGGHFSQRRGGTPDLAGLVVEDLPFDAENCCLDAFAAAEMVLSRKPTLVMLGRSVMIKPDDVAPVAAAARKVGAKTIFDASHVAGLIAGRHYPNPLALGADILTSSTYKTLLGRPHALVLGRDPKDARRLADVLETKLLANYDAGKLPSLLLTLQEAKTDIASYAQHVVQNTKRLAALLRQEGLAVLSARDDEIGTHQLLVPLDASVSGPAKISAMATRNILVGTCPDPTRAGREALRIGTQFITAGTEPDLAAVARRFADVFISSKNAAASRRL
ncbi:glycine hydroxymethyltransferase [Shinella kummerowiae]|uniref:glycine hydroxymethyltransferase n=1 Tax=Shinella kummerowiae TaxID=417745 RepID=UPI0021B6ADE6|nr:glycine hydroxymethyltransferase [Shinella kummerowiae]MCT7664132.1 glycine hydroxymethyltransferase [Shinella kummerowiae]